MSMITIEDALKQINNRFKLVLVAAKRARKISVYGSHALVDWDKNTPIIVALREIACGYKFDNKGNYVFKDIINIKNEKDNLNLKSSKESDEKVSLFNNEINNIKDDKIIYENLNLVGSGFINNND